jgi:[NiFe] hydrogenase diaphorase moiety large subunit
VTHGYLHQPTVVNNVETLLAAALVAKHGAGWFRSRGTAKSPGSKVLSVSGDCERPGIYEYPMGVTVRQVLDDAGAKATQAVQVGGPSGVLLSQLELNRRLAYEDCLGSGSLMVFDERRDMLEVVLNFARFFAHESCGFCTPCRVGTTLLARSVGALASGKGTRKDLKDALRVSRLLKDASHCGLGHGAANPMLDLHAKFRPTIEQRLSSLEIQPTFDLDEALAPARELTGRDDPLAHLEDA